MPGIVIRYRRCFQQGRPCRVTNGIGVAINVPKVDRRDRPPVLVVILSIEAADIAVGRGEVEKGKQARVFPKAKSSRCRNGPGDAIPAERRTLEPEKGDLRLVGGPGAGRGDAIAAEILDFVVIRRVSLP